MKMTQYLKWKADSSKGEVFTPIELVCKILDKIPDEVWRNPNATFLDPCMGKGTFLLEIVRRLVYIYGYTEDDAKSRVYGYDIRVKYINHLTRRGFKNVRHKDFLNEIIEMEFDVVLGNPPYQIKVGENNTEPIWNKFVFKSFELVKEDGYVALIHPSGWRNISGRFKDVQNLIKLNKTHYLSIHNEKDGKDIFGAETRFDYHITQKKSATNYETVIRFQDNKVSKLNITNMEFIPNGGIDDINFLVAKEGEERVNLLHDESSYAHRKVHMSKEQIGEYIYPCIYTVNYLSTPKLWYSSVNNKGHFGVPKIVWSNGRISSVGSFIDENGDYGIMEYGYAIVDTVENLPLIKSAIDSAKFKNLMELCAVGQLTINHKVIATFKKDFWRHFIDE